MTKTADAWEAPEVILPEDTTKSRLQRPTPKPDTDDVATAGERIEAFWEKYPDGSILTEVETREVSGQYPYSVYTVRAFIRKNGDADGPDSTAHATRSENDPDPVTAQYAQETAETSAISRALRYIGILATPRKPAVEPPAPAAAPAVSKPPHPLKTARESASLSQKELAIAMSLIGCPWTQATVSKIERGTRALAADEAREVSLITGYEVTP